MSFGTAVMTVYRKYVDFQGRARRSEYWFFQLFYFLVSVVLFILMSLTAGTNGSSGALGTILALVLLVFSLGTFLPALAVLIRRLHDTDRSGWWIFLGLVPLVGPIILIIWYCTKGTTGPNKYGLDPVT